jgi:alpha-tubulin suppressor-like RCC1 family protein
MQLESNH